MKLTLTKRQKEVMEHLEYVKAYSPETAYSPCGADVQICWNLEKKGVIASVQKYPKGHPYEDGTSWGYEVRHFYMI